MTSPTPPRRRTLLARLAVASAALVACAALLPAQQSMTPVAREVNKKMVKLYGAGGFKGLPSYGTGILVSPDGYILTANAQLLDTRDLRVHLWDGTKYHGEVVAQEPELDVALVKIGTEKDKVEDALLRMLRSKSNASQARNSMVLGLRQRQVDADGSLISGSNPDRAAIANVIRK